MLVIDDVSLQGTLSISVMPEQAGIQQIFFYWAIAFAGVTETQEFKAASIQPLVYHAEC